MTSFPTPARVLAIYAHPDDPEVSCAGTLARWAREGASVHLLIAARGEKGTSDPTVDPDELAALRANESAAAASALGVASQHNLGWPDGEVENNVELRGELVAQIRELTPDVVVAPDPTAIFFGSRYVNHHDHRELGFAVLDACAPAASSPAYFRDAGPPHHVGAVFLSGTLAPDTWIDIGDTIDAKVAALQCHRSQLGGDVEVAADVVQRRARAAGAEGGVTYAEAFRVIALA